MFDDLNDGKSLCQTVQTHFVLILMHNDSYTQANQPAKCAIMIYLSEFFSPPLMSASGSALVQTSRSCENAVNYNAIKPYDCVSLAVAVALALALPLSIARKSWRNNWKWASVINWNQVALEIVTDSMN